MSSPPFPTLTDVLLSDALLSVHELPQEQLERLVASGEVMSITSFDDHMRPDVHWIAPEEYRKAFEELTGADTMPDEAAFTKPEGSYPGYANIQRDHTGAFILTVRADPMPSDGPVECGQTSVVTIPEDDWYQLLANAGRLSIPKDPDHADEPAGADAAAAGDPLGQRAQPIPDAVHESDAIIVEPDAD